MTADVEFEAESSARGELRRIVGELKMMGVGANSDVRGADAVDYLNTLLERLSTRRGERLPVLEDVEERRYRNVTMATTLLAEARDLLSMVGASKAADSVRRAMKSVEGAGRNARRRLTNLERQIGYVLATTR